MGGGKVSDAKDIDRLRSSLEKLIGGAGGRALTRLASLKRPSVGTDPTTTDQKKALLNKLKGGMLLHVATAATHIWSSSVRSQALVLRMPSA